LIRKKNELSRAIPVRARCENDQCRLPKYANRVETKDDTILAFSAPCGAIAAKMPRSMTSAIAPTMPKAATSFNSTRQELRR
jgi:hypothetical protein